MEINDIYIAIIVMAIANFITRVFPFIFFAKNEPPQLVSFIANYFPPIIMTILIFYTLSKIDFTQAPYALKEISAIIFTALLHIKFNNYLISIFLGTMFYMLLYNYISFI